MVDNLTPLGAGEPVRDEGWGDALGKVLALALAALIAGFTWYIGQECARSLVVWVLNTWR